MKEIIILLVTNFATLLTVAEVIPEAKIYGGHYAEKNQFPYEISLQENNKHKCGGAILAKSYVLTAAHCVTDENRNTDSASSYVVVAGTINIDEGGRNYEPNVFIVHDGYRCCEIDLALIQLKTNFDWDESIKPISIYEKELKKNSAVTISGWGYYNTDKVVSKKLKYNTFFVRCPRDCKKILRSLYFQGLLCIYHPNLNGACNGDSGGPATFQDQLVGIASFVFKPCGSTKPDIYVKVLYYLDWINDNILDDIIFIKENEN